MTSFKFGSFDYICERASLTICPLLGTLQGVEPTCYSRNVQLGSQIIFQPATCFVHIAALCMTIIMLLHVRSKYTAVGRKEIVLFFYMFMFIELLAIFLDSAIIPTASNVYPWFAAVYAGALGSLYWCILINGFVGFQFHEDGTPMSLWFLRLSSLVVWGICFFIAIATFNSYASFSFASPTALFITYLIFPAACVVVYVISQLILVIRTLDDRWVIGDILFGAAFYVVGCVLLFAFSIKICDAVIHYIDGVFFFSLCMLLSVMMVYKYWDSITKEDLEFSVGSKAAVWEVKDPLLPANPEYIEDDAQSSFRGAGGSLVGGYGGNQYYSNSHTGPAQQYQLQQSSSGLSQQYPSQGGYGGLGGGGGASQYASYGSGH